MYHGLASGVKARRGMKGGGALPVSVLLLAGVTVWLGCQRGADLGSSQVAVPRTGNHAPLIRHAALVPSPLVLNGPISVMIDAQDLDRNPLRFRYLWIVNGQRLEQEQGEELAPDRLRRGDQVSVEIWPHDGMVEGTSFTTVPVTIGNSPPVIRSVKLDPEVFVPGARVRAVVHAVDADHDMVHLRYRWWHNQTVVQDGEGDEFDTGVLVRGDTLAVEVVASDATDSGSPVRSAQLSLLNTPPRIVSVRPASTSGNVFTYQVEAMDAEQDSLTFGLEQAPSDMGIDVRKGLISWHVSPGAARTHTVRILVTDSHGATAFRDFELHVPVSHSVAPVLAPEPT
jgi:hypothetical protein